MEVHEYVTFFSTNGKGGPYHHYPKHSEQLLDIFLASLRSIDSPTANLFASSGAVAAWSAFATKAAARNPIQKRTVRLFCKEPMEVQRAVLCKLSLKMGYKNENLWRSRFRSYFSTRHLENNNERNLPPLWRKYLQGLKPNEDTSIQRWHLETFSSQEVFAQYATGLSPDNSQGATTPTTRSDSVHTEVPDNAQGATTPTTRSDSVHTEVPDNAQLMGFNNSVREDAGTGSSSSSADPYWREIPGAIHAIQTFALADAMQTHALADTIHTFALADATQMEILFPFLEEAVVRYPRTHYASIAMAFPNTPYLPQACQVSFEIKACYVQKYTQEFFDLDLKEDGKLVAVSSETKGWTINPVTSIAVRGFRPDKVISLFGTWAEGIMAAAKYNSTRGTIDSIWMSIHHNANYNATLTVEIRQTEACMLRHLLYI